MIERHLFIIKYVQNINTLQESVFFKTINILIPAFKLNKIICELSE